MARGYGNNAKELECRLYTSFLYDPTTSGDIADNKVVIVHITTISLACVVPPGAVLTSGRFRRRQKLFKHDVVIGRLLAERDKWANEQVDRWTTHGSRSLLCFSFHLRCTVNARCLMLIEDVSWIVWLLFYLERRRDINFPFIESTMWNYRIVLVSRWIGMPVS